MENIGMFIVGSVVFGLYLTGYLYMIKYANDSYDKDIKNDSKNRNIIQQKATKYN